MTKHIHFAHGNGFPSPCYNQLFKHLEPDFACYYVDRIGHSPEYPVTENWSYLVEELLDSVRQLAKDGPVIGLGHSLGGALTLLAAMQAPSLFQQVIVMDSPLFNPLKYGVLRLSKRLGLIDRVTPARQTRGRRRHWKSRGEAIAYLRKRALFKQFSEACLNDYVTYGMEQSDTGYTLRFDTEVEYQIYCTIPHALPDYAGYCRVPVALIYGSESNVVRPIDRRYMKKKFGISSIKTPGSHMFPFESPETVAKLIASIVNSKE